MNLLGKATIVSTDADFNRYILQSEGRMFENSCPTSIAEIMGRWSMLALAGDVHREMRSIAVNFMSNVKLRTYFLPDVEQQAKQILSGWRHGSTFSAQEEGKKVCFSFDLSLFFSSRRSSHSFTLMASSSSFCLFFLFIFFCFIYFYFYFGFERK